MLVFIVCVANTLLECLVLLFGVTAFCLLRLLLVIVSCLRVWLLVINLGWWVLCDCLFINVDLFCPCLGCFHLECFVWVVLFV